MRLSDAGVRCRPTELIYPNHRLPPWLIEASTPRSLEPIVRCHPTKPQPCPPKLALFASFAVQGAPTSSPPPRSILRQHSLSRKRRRKPEDRPPTWSAAPTLRNPGAQRSGPEPTSEVSMQQSHRALHRADSATGAAAHLTEESAPTSWDLTMI
jgi:hypothetical protein